jgi:hypothetical protein
MEVDLLAVFELRKVSRTVMSRYMKVR